MVVDRGWTCCAIFCFFGGRGITPFRSFISALREGRKRFLVDGAMAFRGGNTMDPGLAERFGEFSDARDNDCLAPFQGGPVG